eukprot:7237880-Alexandrium_andersonii.AAC.1
MGSVFVVAFVGALWYCLGGILLATCRRAGSCDIARACTCTRASNAFAQTAARLHACIRYASNRAHAHTRICHDRIYAYATKHASTSAPCPGGITRTFR